MDGMDNGWMDGWMDFYIIRFVLETNEDESCEQFEKKNIFFTSGFLFFASLPSKFRRGGIIVSYFSPFPFLPSLLTLLPSQYWQCEAHGAQRGLGDVLEGLRTTPLQTRVCFQSDETLSSRAGFRSNLIQRLILK